MGSTTQLTGTFNATGIKPTGESAFLPVSGQRIINMSPLGANATYSTGWLEVDGFTSVLYVIQSDKASADGGVIVEYSQNGSDVSTGGTGRSYNTNPSLFQTALVPKGKYVRIRYINGTQAQTTFYFEVRFSDDLVQPTLTSVNNSITGTNLAQVSASILYGPDGQGTYSPIDLSGVATAAKQLPNNHQVAVSNFPTSTSQAQPANATVYTRTTTTSATTVLDANANRKGATFFSVSGTILIKLGTGASSTSFTARLVTNGYYELPYPAYTGVVTAIGAGTLNVTETF